MLSKLWLLKLKSMRFRIVIELDDEMRTSWVFEFLDAKIFSNSNSISLESLLQLNAMASNWYLFRYFRLRRVMISYSESNGIF